MRFIYILLILCCYFDSADGQSSKSILITDALHEIEKQFDIRISYASDDLSSYVNWPTNCQSHEECMVKLFLQTGYKIEQVDSSRYIILENEMEERLVCFEVSYNGLPIENVLIFTSDQAFVTESDAKGFAWGVVKTHEEKMSTYHLGYEDQTIPVSNDQCTTQELKPKVYELDGLTFTEYLSDGISVDENGILINVKQENRSLMPGAIDNDIFEAITFLPGINSPFESLDEISVRGSTPDQNAIYYDDIPIFQASHLFGNISAINPFYVEEVNLYKSGIDARFGERVASVIDIQSVVSPIDRWKGSTGMNFTHGHLELKGPLWKGSSLALGYRRSFTDTWSSPTFSSYANKVFQGTKAEDATFNDNQGDLVSFSDISLRFDFKAGRNKFNLTLLGVRDDLTLVSSVENQRITLEDRLFTETGGAKLGWSREWNKRLSSELKFIGSGFVYNYSLQAKAGQPLEELDWRSSAFNELTEASLNLDFDYHIDQNKHLKFGTKILGNDISLILQNQRFEEVEQDSQQFTNELGILYGSYTTSIIDRIEFNIGLRYIVNYRNQKDYFEPRIGVSTKLSESLRLKVSTGKHFQFISQVVALDVNNIGLSNKIWVASNDDIIPVIESNQWSGGLIFQDQGWTVDGEIFVKELAGITTFSSDLEGQPYTIGAARIRGIDFLLKKRYKKLQSWLSYSLTSALFDFKELQIQPFPITNNQVHRLTLANIYKTNPWEFAASITLASGLPYTPTQGLELSEPPIQRWQIEYAGLNSGRLQPYFMINGSIRYTYNITKWLRGDLSIAIRNLTNRKNILRRRHQINNNDPISQPNIESIDEIGLRFTVNCAANWYF